MVDDVIAMKTLTTEKFIKEVNKIVLRNGCDYMDAVIHVCEKNGIEIEAAASMIKNNTIIKSKIQHQAEDLNYLPKRARLPI